MTTHKFIPLVSNGASWLAAIDTSSDRAGVALFDGSSANVIAWNARRNHTVTTLEQIDHLLRLSGIELSDLGAVAVAIGPGSFSALRVGSSIAKGLSFAMNIPLLGVSTTEAIASQLRWTDRPVIAVMTAGRGRVVWSRYETGTLVDGPRNTTVAELKDSVGDALVAGETNLLDSIDAIELPVAGRVEQIARVGWARFTSGERDDPAMIEPLYAHGRRSDAVRV
jgi:tRNA threonylcarbamoyladenosine biosynthesis protein TsaB